MNTKSFTLIISLMLLLIVSATCSNTIEKKEDAKEFRAVWLHQTLFDRNVDTATKQITRLFDSYAGIGINHLFCYYTLKEENKLDWDFLQLIIEEGHKREISIHPVFCPGHEVDLVRAQKEHPDWLIRDIEGKTYPSYNMSLPEVRIYWLERISKALDYDIDGIHLDYIRYPLNQMFSYDSVTCRAFEQEYGVSPLNVSHDGGSIIWCEWIKWNAMQVTAMVRETRGLISKSGKKIVLGADVFPDPEESKTEIAQDWGAWAKEKLVDFVCPMLYTNDTTLFARYLEAALRTANGTCKVYPGIGIKTSHNNITKEILIKEIEISRKRGAEGVAFFSGNSLVEEWRKFLGKTAFKPPLPGK